MKTTTPPFLSHVIFKIFGQDISDDELTSIMGVSPTKTIKGGDPVAPKATMTYSRSCWLIDTGKMTALDLGDEIEKMIKLVSPGVRRLREQIDRSWEDWSLDLSVPIYTELRAPSLYVDSEVLKTMGELGIKLDVDIYPLWEAPPLRPKVGVTSMLTHKRHLLTGVRRGSHGAGQRAFPGGHLEWWKTWEETAVEEILEETGLKAAVVPGDEPYCFVTNTRIEADMKHYTTAWVPCVLVEEVDVTKRIPALEPDKCEGWDWLTLDELFQELLGKEDFTYEDILAQDPEQAEWLPMKRLLAFSGQLDLEWPERLSTQVIPSDFWAKT